MLFFQKTLLICIFITLGSSQVVEAQRPFMVFFNGIQDFFANLRPIAIPPSNPPAPWPISEPISDIEDFNNLAAPESVLKPTQSIQQAEPQKPLQNFFGNIQQFFATRRPFGKPATTTPAVPQWPTEELPPLNDFNNVEVVEAVEPVPAELITISKKININIPTLYTFLLNNFPYDYSCINGN